MENKKITLCKLDKNLEKICLHEDLEGLIWFVDKSKSNIYNKSLIAKNDYISAILEYDRQEPSAIDLRLAIRECYDEVKEVGYFPSYKKFSPAQRYKYIEFLANPYNVNCDIGFAFTLLYGLERHLMIGNFDRALNVIMKMREVFDNNSFQSYSLDTILISSALRNRQEVIYRLEAENKLEIKDNPNVYVFIKALCDGVLLADEMMRISYKFGFKNKGYINKYSDLFFNILNNLCVERYGMAGLPIRKFYKKDTPEKLLLLIANYSLPHRECYVPDLFSDEEFVNEGFELLSKTHQMIKDLKKQKGFISNN